MIAMFIHFQVKKKINTEAATVTTVNAIEVIIAQCFKRNIPIVRLNIAMPSGKPINAK